MIPTHLRLLAEGYVCFFLDKVGGCGICIVHTYTYILRMYICTYKHRFFSEGTENKKVRETPLHACINLNFMSISTSHLFCSSSSLFGRLTNPFIDI